MTRETPFHKAHSTQIAGLSKVVGDDERFYNNLFVGHNGLAGYAKDAVNLQAGGNVFLAGSRPAANERSPLLLPGTSPRLELQERPDGWYLRMTMDDSWLRDGGRALVTSDVLGKAKVPDLPYEQPDGAPIRIDTDYFGKQRNAANPAPGPFENPGSGPLSLKVKHLIIEKQTTKESP
ncbi:MAG: hypothetical protein NTV49_13775 [Kiritimatiellaeota bacterium]|nr:hypothetical protein [Kiritimatiellota bacterium]